MVGLLSLRKVVRYESSSENYTFYLVMQAINTRSSCSVSTAVSFDDRKTILHLSHGFLAIQKTVAELTRESLAR